MTAAENKKGIEPKKQDAKEERATITVRGVSVQRWNAVKQRAEERGLKLKYALDEMFDLWLNNRD